MEYPRDTAKLDQPNEYAFEAVPSENYGYRWSISPVAVAHFRPDSPPYWGHPHVTYWDDRRCQSPDDCIDSPKTPPVGKYCTIQPRSIDANARDQRMLYSSPLSPSDNSVPLTKKRKGNNRYGQSGSHRCLRCQKGKRKVFTLFLHVLTVVCI